MTKWTVPEPTINKDRSAMLMYCEQIKRLNATLRSNPYPKSKDDISRSIDFIIQNIKTILE